MRSNKMKATLLICAVAILLLLQLTAAVKIGISKVNIETTSTTTTTTAHDQMSDNSTEMATTVAAEERTATTDLTEVEIESSSTTKTTNIKTTTTTTTTKPNFTISIFPPRLRTTKTPKITTTTTTALPPPTTTSTTTTLNTTDNSITLNGVLSTKKTTPPGFYYCSCDLMMDACDINCCCDSDCIPEALHVFNCMDESMHHAQLKNRLKDFQYQHGLPSCKVNDGWLCVFRTNIQREQQKAPKLDWDLNHYYKWSEPVWNFESEQHSNEDLEHYKYGEPLQLLNMKTMILSQLDLPHTFKPPHCQIKQTVKFLKSHSTNCLLDTIEEMQSNARNLLTSIQNHQLLLNPLKQANELDHITPISSDFKLKFCQKQLCEDVLLNNSTALELRLKAHYITEIKLKFLHNYTQLLGGLLELRESTNSPLNITELWQHIHVEYIYKNITTNDVSKKINETAFTQENLKKLTSGPLGYLQGAPIIIARFIANNESDTLSPTNQVLDYFHVNSTKSHLNHTLTLFTTHQGYCMHELGGNNFINYGINTLNQCKLRYSTVSVSKLSQKQRNYTEICMKLQKQINTQFFSANNFLIDVKSSEIFVSQLGRPANRSVKWTPLHIRRNQHDFAPISGEYNAQTHSFSCRNMLINIAYEFLVGHFEEANIEHQALVKQATLIFGERNDLEFDMNEVIEVPLMITVMFYDYAKDVNNGGGAEGVDANIIWRLVLLNFLVLYASNILENS